MDAAFGPDGTLYFASAGSDSATNRGPIEGYVVRSKDLGKTWQFAVGAKPQEREFTLLDGSKATSMERFQLRPDRRRPQRPEALSVLLGLALGLLVAGLALFAVSRRRRVPPAEAS